MFFFSYEKQSNPLNFINMLVTMRTILDDLQAGLNKYET